MSISPTPAPNGKCRVIVKAVVVHDGKMLALRRAPHDTRSGTWDLPGGNLEYGEDLLHRLHTEIREEAGLEVDALTLLDAVSYRTLSENFVMAICWVGQARSTDVVLGPDHDAYEWITPEEFLKRQSTTYFRGFVRTFISALAAQTA